MEQAIIPEQLNELKTFLQRIPAVGRRVAVGEMDENLWWAKFTIDISHPLAWQVVQRLGHILNYLSIEERLPTVFMPVSPPPYLNGGPEQFLSWVVESKIPDFSPTLCIEWLEARLPRPIEDKNQWNLDFDDDDEE